MAGCRKYVQVSTLSSNAGVDELDRTQLYAQRSRGSEDMFSEKGKRNESWQSVNSI